jgi:acetolactate synthase-1/2/3 large subunit
MRTTGAKLIVRALEDDGVTAVLGIPGTHNIELWDALESSASIEPVLVTHEVGAAFMADGRARSGGGIGVVAVVPGAGVTHALSGVAEALMDNVPMLILASAVRSDTGAAYQLHAIDQLAVLRPVTKSTIRVEEADSIYACVRGARAIALQPPCGPVAVEIPANLIMLTQDVSEPSWTEADRAQATVDPEVLERAARILTEASRPLLYLGRGAEGAGARLVSLAETLGTPVVTTFQGKGVFPESHPLSLWTGFGNQAPAAVRRVAAGCDAMLAIGCRFSEVATGSYGIDPPAPLVHVDIAAEVLGRNFPTDVVAACDATVFVDGLLGLLRGSRPWRAVGEEVGASREAADARRSRARTCPGTVPARDLFGALQRHCRDDAVYATDSGNGTFLAAEHLRLEAAGRFLAPVDFSCMGYAVPAAIGAAMARPGHDVVALPGDGAFLMTGLEILTAASTRCGVLVCVLRDGRLGQIAHFQQIPMNRRTCSVLPEYSVAHVAAAVGAPFFRVVETSELDVVLPAALEITRGGVPAVVEVMLDPRQRSDFTRGVVKTNFLRLPWRDRLRMLGRAVGRRL